MFQSTPLREGRLGAVWALIILEGFNPRPCARGDHGGTLLYSIQKRFQSTPLREGRLTSSGVHLSLRMFQSTPLREGRRHVEAKN